MLKTTKRPAAFVLVATNHGTMMVDRRDCGAIFETSACGQEEIDVSLQLLDARKANFGPGVVALDCGANVGMHAIEWAKHMHGWGSVTAFEARERIFYALAGNIALNNCFNARAVWTAVGAADGTIGMPVPDHLAPSGVGGAAKSVETAMRAIDSFALPRLDFAKIGVGGMAMEALAGASNTIAAHKPMLLIESNKTDLGNLGRRLDEMGYRCFTFGAHVIALHASDPNSARVAATK